MSGKDIPLLCIRVLDLAGERASFCSKLLAGMGAEVVRIEPPGGDPSRATGSFRKSSSCPDSSLFFLYHNAGKKSITLNLEHSRGRELFKSLISQADVLVESFDPGYLENLGLHYTVLQAINPRIITASVTGFGQDGPYSSYRSCDLVSSAMGGQMFVCGTPERYPLKLYGNQSSYVASLFSAVGILIALLQRRATGCGQWLDLSTHEAVTSTLEYVMMRYFNDGVVSERNGNVYWNGSASVLPCKDGYILLTFGREWGTLIELVESENMAEDLTEEKWKEEEYRTEHIDHIIEVLAKWTSSHTVTELFETGQLMRFPWAPVNSPEDLFDDPQLNARDFFIDVEHPECNRSFLYPGLPWRFSGFHPGTQGRAPLPGEHNYKIYHNELGISAEEIERLAQARII
jgi:crotonobetainyl-CoA:carnitine CoA-transferase CaiB-like acyl-CoA transferase